MTSLENVMVAAQISLPDVPKKELIKMCRDSLVMVGLDDSQITRKVTELSGGQQQRVAIARALITDAKYILADELQEIWIKKIEEKLSNCYSR